MVSIPSDSARRRDVVLDARYQSVGTFPQMRSYGSDGRDVKAGSDAPSEPPLSRSPPTIIDLAAHAGVSKTTVSRALNGSPRIASATRARVFAAIDELGFQVNLAARSLRTAKTGLVGFLVPIISIFGLIVEELDRELAEDGFSILLTSSRRRDTARDVQAIETLTSRGVDALVIAPSNDRSPELREFLRMIRTPVILLDRDVRGVTADAVLIDQGPGILGAIDHLVEEGRSRIGVLLRDSQTRSARQIRVAYEQGLARHRLTLDPALVGEFTDLDHEAGRTGVHQLLDAGADAIISTGTIEFTASVLEQLSARNISVPTGLSLVVYGHRAAATSHAGRLPMVAYPIEDIARATRRLLGPRLAGSSAPARVEHVNTIFFGPSTSLHKT
jgi:LacI family transcriptional regulator